MNWLDIFCFTSVARTQSFSITARELMISQQAVSRHIRALEDELGFPLFLRGVQNVRLTKAGDRMLQYFTERERLTADFKKGLSRHTETDTLRIACTQWLGCPPVLGRAIEVFKKKSPSVTPLIHDLNAKELNRALLGDEVDILITTRYAAAFLPILWQSDVLSEEPIYLVASSRESYDPAQLSHYTHIADSAGEPDDASIRARVHRTYEKLGAQPRRIDILPEMGSVCLNLLMNGGISLGMTKPALADNPDFDLIHSGLTATVLICLPPHERRGHADDFLQAAREVRA